jgi:hypothetical protein
MAGSPRATRSTRILSPVRIEALAEPGVLGQRRRLRWTGELPTQHVVGTVNVETAERDEPPRQARERVSDDLSLALGLTVRIQHYLGRELGEPSTMVVQMSTIAVDVSNRG